MVRQDVFSGNKLSGYEEVNREGGDVEMFISKDEYNRVNVDEDIKVDSESEKAEISLSSLGDNLCISDKSSQASPPTKPVIAWTKDIPTASNFQRFPSEPRSAGEEDIPFPDSIPTRSRQAILSSEHSSVPTSSSEVDGQNQAELGLVPRRDYEGDTSPLESVQIVD